METNKPIKELLPIKQGHGQPWVNARALWKCLQVQTPFNKWVVRRLKELESVENNDFWTCLIKSTGGRPSKDYQITLPLAKELAMIESQYIRKCFIEKPNIMAIDKGFFNEISSMPQIKKEVLKHVYLIYSSSSKLYKIGISQNVELRFKSLQNASGNKLELITYKVSHEASRIESDLHQRFSQKRKHGEWFKLDKSDVVYIYNELGI